MKNFPMREIAKFAAGLVAADFLWVLWFSQQHMSAVRFFGTTITPGLVLPMLVFDLALLIMLVHYGWHVGKIPAMRERSYIFIAGCIFSFVAFIHIWRIFSGAAFIVGDWVAPSWLSWFGVVVATYMGYMSFHIAARIKDR